MGDNIKKMSRKEWSHDATAMEGGQAYKKDAVQ